MTGEHSRNHVIMTTDIASFGSRPDGAQLVLRKALYEVTEGALEAARIPLNALAIEDRGDGLLVLAPSTIPPGEFIDHVAPELRARIRRHNEAAAPLLVMRVRMALHEGHVHRDSRGYAGTALIHAFRLLDAEGFKSVFAADRAHLALIVSHRFHADVIAPGLGRIDPETFREIVIVNKETRTRAWVEGLRTGTEAVPVEAVALSA